MARTRRKVSEGFLTLGIDVSSRFVKNEKMVPFGIGKRIIDLLILWDRMIFLALFLKDFFCF